MFLFLLQMYVRLDIIREKNALGVKICVFMIR